MHTRPVAKPAYQSFLTTALAVGFGSALLAITALGAAAAVSPQFDLVVSPALPTSGERVTISVLASNFNTASTTFTWYRDDTKVSAASGPGRSRYSFLAGGEGIGNTVVRVQANPGEGYGIGERSTTVVVVPAATDQQPSLPELTSAFTLDVSNPNPDVGETVTVAVITYAFDRQRADYQWYVSGALDRAQSGRGRSSIRVASPAEGGEKTIRVNVTTPSGDARSQSTAIRTISAPLYWWADTSVPYWYKGKALPALHSRVSVAALPRVSSPPALIYNWKFNGSALPAASGVGQRTFSFMLTLPVAEEIGVGISDGAGSLAKSASVRIGPVRPEVGIYEVRPLVGVVFEKTLTDFAAPAGDPYDFLATPFFFPRPSVAGLRYRWVLNGQEISGEFAAPWLFTLKSKGGETSSNSLTLDVSDPQPAGDQTFAAFRVNLR